MYSIVYEVKLKNKIVFVCIGRKMKARKILYTCSGVFNCVVGGIGCFLGFMFFVLSKVIRNMFSESSQLLENLVEELSSISTEYEYLKDATNNEVVDYVMRIVYMVGAVFLILGLIWIAFGVFNCMLSSRHYLFFGKRPVLKVVFIIASWILLTFNIANITTTIAVFKKDKDIMVAQSLYTSENQV